MTERESSLAERERKDAERAAAIRDRQIRLGHVDKPKRSHKKKEESEPEA